MRRSPYWSSKLPAAAWRYGLSIGLVGASLAFTLLLESTLASRFWFIFFAAIMIGAWFGGKGPGWLAAILSLFAVDFFLLPPSKHFTTNTRDLPFLITFAAFAVASAWISSTLKQTQASLKQTRDELESRVAERTAELNRFNDALRESERELRLQTEVIAQQIWSALPDGSIEYCNQRLLTYHGCPMEEMRGLGFARFIHPEDRDRVIRAWGQAVSQGTVYDIEARLLGSSGEYRWFLIRGLPLRDAEGQITKWYGTNTDIEARKRAEQALLNSQSELARLSRILTMGELATSIAHEVNQPLAAVVTNADACLRWLAVDPPNLSKARESLAWIVNEGNRASEIIRRIRQLSKKSAVQRTVLEINGLVPEVIGLLGSELTRNHCSVETELAQAPLHVLGDRVQLQQVLLNLVMNAIEAMSAVTDRPRELWIRSGKMDGNALLSVCDCGPGLDPGVLERLFDAFVTTKSDGIGMGLSISRTIVESHGGRLWATANRTHGATFQLMLPLVTETSA